MCVGLGVNLVWYVLVARLVVGGFAVDVILRTETTAWRARCTWNSLWQFLDRFSTLESYYPKGSIRI